MSWASSFVLPPRESSVNYARHPGHPPALQCSLALARPSPASPRPEPRLRNILRREWTIEGIKEFRGSAGANFFFPLLPDAPDVKDHGTPTTPPPVTPFAGAVPRPPPTGGQGRTLSALPLRDNPLASSELRAHRRGPGVKKGPIPIWSQAKDLQNTKKAQITNKSRQPSTAIPLDMSSILLSLDFSFSPPVCVWRFGDFWKS